MTLSCVGPAARNPANQAGLLYPGRGAPRAPGRNKQAEPAYCTPISLSHPGLSASIAAMDLEFWILDPTTSHYDLGGPSDFEGISSQ